MQKRISGPAGSNIELKAKRPKHGREPISYDLERPVEPTHLLGTRLHVKWDDAWYWGKVVGFDDTTLKHKIRYDDGDEEQLLLGLTPPVKLQLASLEELPLPSVQQLVQLADKLLNLKAEAEAAAAAGNSGPAQRRLKQKEADDLSAKAQHLLELSDALLAGSAAQQAEQPQPLQVPCTLQAGSNDAPTPAAAAGEADATAGLAAAAEAAAAKLLDYGAVHVANVPGLGYTHVEWLPQQPGPGMTVAEAQQQLNAQRDQQQQYGAGNDLLCLEQALDDAFTLHQEQAQQHSQLWKEMDVSLRVAPEALVGRWLRVFWPFDDAWFLCCVEAWDPLTARHQVTYEDDNTSDQLWLGVERVRLLISKGEQLKRPDAPALQQLAQRYMEQAALLEQQQQQPQQAVEDEEERGRPQRLRSKAEMLLGAAHLKASQQVVATWRPAKHKRPVLPAAAGTGEAGGDSGRGRGRGRARGRGKAVARTAGKTQQQGAAGAAAAAQFGADVAVDQPDKQVQQQEQDSSDACVGAQQAQEQLGVAAAGSTEHSSANEQLVLQEQQNVCHTLQAAAVIGRKARADSSAVKSSPLDGSHLLRPAPDAAPGKPQQQQQRQESPLSSATPAAGKGQSPCCCPSSAGAGAGTGDDGGSREGSSVLMNVAPGEVVWVQSKGNPPWPAMVITCEEADDFSIPRRMPRSGQVCVQFFGDYARGRVSPSVLIPTEAALAQRLWLPTLLLTTRRKFVDTYRLALQELITYCQTGELPDPEMVPEHNDERWLNDDLPPDLLEAVQQQEELQAAADAAKRLQDIKRLAADLLNSVCGNTSAGRSRGKRPAAAAAPEPVLTRYGASEGPGGVKLPLQLSATLTLLALGRVEFLHPRFHSEKFIWPVGYAVRRRARTPASGNKERWHLAEILEQPDGSGPLFRVTPEGGQAVTGNTPTEAWQELYKLPAAATPAAAAAAAIEAAAPAPAAAAANSAARASARAISANGAKLYGLQHQQVAGLIQALPHAADCERFLAWTVDEAQRPQPQKLTPELLLSKRVIAARLQRLPAGVTSRPLSRAIVGACDACGEELEAPDNLLVECDNCRLLVHMRCYGVSEAPGGGSWLCDVCRLPCLSAPPPCVLCPCVGGAMKATAEGGWCHLLCATWIPGMCVADQTRMEPIVGVNKVGKDRRSLVCSICGQQYGACIQCAGSSKCYAAFHATCARDAGYPMAAVYDEDSSDDDEQPPETVGQAAAAAAAAAATAAAAAGPVAAPARLSSSSMGEGAGAAPDAPGAAAGPAAAKSRRKGRPKKARKEGTAAGDNTRLFCFCPRHRHVAAGVADSLIHQTTVGGPSPSLQLLAGQSSALLAGSAAGNSAAGSAGGSAGAGCHQEVTSPHRQPDRQAAGGAAAWPGLAAAAAGGVTLFGDATAAAGSCARSRPADTAVRRGMRAPDALAAALRKRLYVRALPYRVTSCTCAGQLLPPPIKRGRVTGPEFHSTCPQQQAGGCNGVSSSGSSPPAACATATHRPAVGAGVAAGIGACAAAGVAASLCPGRRQSQLERYRQMVASTAERVSSGKSAIHGLGVFANVAHSAGDYVVEYMGHLVRPLVADRLEAHTYNQLVGAGTYIFRLNADFNVDATRAGNIAHLINHSCAPCCHSRTITLACPDTGEQQDHVVIVASRDIAVGEELTYDYRFAGDEKLRCNCGAPACRGWVNAPFSCESPQAGVLRLPKRDLMPLPPGAGTDTTAAASSLRPQRLMLGS